MTGPACRGNPGPFFDDHRTSSTASGADSPPTNAISYGKPHDSQLGWGASTRSCGAKDAHDGDFQPRGIPASLIRLNNERRLLMIREVTYYRVVCDASDCKASPQDDSDYTAWASPDGALDDMHDCEDWYTDGSQHLCDEHAPICAKPDCQVKLSDAEFGAFCEDHPPSKVSSGSAT